MCLNCGVGEDSWESLGLQGRPTVHPKGNQSWIFIGRTDAEAEASILWPPVKSWLTGKDPDAGKDRGQEEKGVTEDEMVGWHHWLNGHEFEQAPGDGEGQESLVCYSPCGQKESDMTQWLKKTTRSKTSDSNVRKLKEPLEMPCPSWCFKNIRIIISVRKSLCFGLWLYLF